MIRRQTRICPPLYAACAMVLAACAGPQQAAAPEGLDFKAASLAPKGITTIGQVAVAEQGGDKLELTAFAEQRYKMQQVMAVLWCRARDEAKRRKYDGWYALSFRQAFSGSGDERQAGIGVVQMFRGAPPPGKETLRSQKNWCADAPSAAKA